MSEHELCCEACRLFGAEPIEGAVRPSVPMRLRSREIVVRVTDRGGEVKELRFQREQVVIGRAQGSDIILPKGNVSKQAARLSLSGDQVLLFDLKSSCGTYVNGLRINRSHVLCKGDKIYIGDFMLMVEAI
jgi:pilus assembly protein CpaF